MKSLLFSIITLTSIIIVSCVNPPDYPIEPVIEFLRFSNNTMNQGRLNQDSILVTIGFTDGDGDIGDDTLRSIILTETRQNFTLRSNIIPDIRGSGIFDNKGISGEISFVLYTTCCLYDNGLSACEPSTEFPIDTVIYEISILDRAKNESNTIKLDPIYLRCN